MNNMLRKNHKKVVKITTKSSRNDHSFSKSLLDIYIDHTIALNLKNILKEAVFNKNLRKK
jgi:hypothetical protein